MQRVQVKGRNPKKVTAYRRFQIGDPKDQLEYAKSIGIPAEDT